MKAKALAQAQSQTAIKVVLRDEFYVANGNCLLTHISPLTVSKRATKLSPLTMPRRSRQA